MSRLPLIAATALLLTTSCATIAHGRYQNVRVTSDPAGANVRVSCGDAPRDGGVTPATVRLQRKATSCAITLTKPGFNDQTITFTRVTSAWFWANMAFPGIVTEVIVEAATGPPITVFPGAYSDKKQVNVVGFVGGTAGGMLIDHATGAQYKFVPARIDVKLR